MPNASDFTRRTALKAIGAVGVSNALAGRVAADDGTDSDGGADDAEDARTDPFLEIAHRGYANRYPENTLRAVRGAACNDADAIEIDLVPAADGTPVVFHDPELSGRYGGGLTDAEGPVWETPLETVTSAKVLGTDQTVPTLERVLDAIPADVGVVLEFKNPGTTDIRPNENLGGGTLERQKELWLPFARRVLDVAARYDHEYLVAASREAAIAAVKEVDDCVPAAFFFSDSIPVGLDVTRTYDLKALFPPINMITRTPFFESPDYYVEDPDFEDVDLVELAHEEGREIYVFTLNTWYEAVEAKKAGLDGVLVNSPDTLDQVVGPGGEDDTDPTAFPDSCP